MALDTVSYWAKSAPGREYDPARDLECDVVVAGGGIVGVTTALLLAREGANVALLEARRIGSGATGYTTAKLSSLHGLTYASLESKHGDDVARAYGEANEEGIAHGRGDSSSELGIECDFRRKPNFTYTEDPRPRLEAARTRPASPSGSGCRRASVADARGAALRDRRRGPLRRPGRVPPAALPPRARGRGGRRRLRGPRAHPGRLGRPGRSLHRPRPRTGATLQGRSRRRRHPPADPRPRPLLRPQPSRSAPTSCSRGCARRGPPGDVPERREPGALAAVGADAGRRAADGRRRVPQGRAVRRRRALPRRSRRWARERFDVESVEHRWATQDHIPADMLPFVGRLWPLSGRVLTATGMRKWGLAMGTTAAGMLADRRRRAGTTASRARSRPARLNPVAAGARRWPRRTPTSATASSGTACSAARPRTWRPGRARWSATASKQRAVYRDEAGKLHELSARCTHLGCIVALQRRRAQLGLPLPRLALRHRRRGARGARRCTRSAPAD